MEDRSMSTSMRIHLANGWTVSLMSSPEHYCTPGETFECAAWNAAGRWHKFENGNSVQGHMTRREIGKLAGELLAEKRRGGRE